MSRIQLLPEHIVDQIKAGEVIERPASLIKELLENSIDAQSTRISIQIINNGLDLIAIEDNGIGMSFQDLPYAFCRHATSKITKFDDLYQLKSYGFRGEALASISSISKITCSSNTEQNDGGKIVIHGAEEISCVKSSASEKGTSIFITDLFYNTPVRLKFVKSQTSEKNALKRIIDSFLLSSPQIHWTVQWDEKEKMIYPKVENPLERVKQILTPKKKNHAEVEFQTLREEYDQYIIEAYVSENSSPGNSGKKNFILINDRLIVDHALHRMIIRSLETFWGGGHSGHYLVKLSIPSEEIDVNVHPGKTTVKFLKPSIVFSMTSAALKKMCKKETPAIRHQTQLLPNTSEFKELKMSFTPGPETSSSNDRFSSYKLEDDFYIIQFQHSPPFLIKGSILLSSFMSYRIQELLPLSDSDITPLIVSEPIELKTTLLDKSFVQLKEIGFEIDRLDQSTVVLRSIPTFLNPFSQLIIAAFSKLELIKSLPSKLTPQMLLPLFTNILLSESQFAIIFENIPLKILIENKTAKLLDRSNLKSIYESP